MGRFENCISTTKSIGTSEKTLNDLFLYSDFENIKILQPGTRALAARLPQGLQSLHWQHGRSMRACSSSLESVNS